MKEKEKENPQSKETKSVRRGASNQVQKQAADMDSSTSSFPLSKRRKTVDSEEAQQLELTSPDIKLGNPLRFLSNSRNKPITVSTLSNSGGVVLNGEMCSSLSSGDDSSASNESCDIVKYSFRFVDLKAQSFETEISTCINVNKFSAETIPTIELIGDSESEETTSTHGKTPPSQAELDEFFTAAEKYEQVRFTEKYNYDILKDVALDGRYQWIPLKP